MDRMILIKTDHAFRGIFFSICPEMYNPLFIFHTFACKFSAETNAKLKRDCTVPNVSTLLSFVLIFLVSENQEFHCSQTTVSSLSFLVFACTFNLYTL